MKIDKVSIVIPCYYSEKMLKSVVDEILKCIEQVDKYQYEIILINDGSKDETWNVIVELSGKDKRIKGINLSQNFGQHSALMAGYGIVTGDVVVGLDDDGEHNPNEMFQLIDKLSEGYDYVCADYYKHNSYFRSFGTIINNFMATTFIGKPKDVDFSSFYVMRRFVVNELVRYRGPYPYIGGLIMRATRNIASVPLKRRSRIFGTSGYNLKKMISLWLNGFTAFSVKPLRFSSLIGCISAVIGFIFGIITVIRKLVIPNISIGWSSIVSIMLFIGGLIMLMLGMIGEYIGRIYININNSPQYVIKEIINVEKE